MKTIDKTWLRSFVMQIAKPLMSGKLAGKETDNLNYNMSSVFFDGQDGYDTKFKMSMPFGMAFNAPKDVTGFYNSLYSSAYERIIMALIHHKRPVVQNIGEIVHYSTDSTGNQIKTTITLTNDGKLIINAPSSLQIQCNDATVTVTGDAVVNTTNTTVNASAKAKVVSPAIELGGSSLEKIINGETFKQLYNQHAHIDSFGLPVSPVTALMMDNPHLSNTVKAKT